VTTLQALQSLTEYENENLLSKAIADIGLLGTETYVSVTHKEDIDMASASIYETLANHPELREGSYTIKYNSVQLMAMARKIRSRYHMKKATISGKPIW